MNRYLVEYREDEHRGSFLVDEADDAHHAKEQCENAYPNAIVTGVFALVNGYRAARPVNVVVVVQGGSVADIFCDESAHVTVVDYDDHGHTFDGSSCRVSEWNFLPSGGDLSSVALWRDHIETDSDPRF